MHMASSNKDAAGEVAAFQVPIQREAAMAAALNAPVVEVTMDKLNITRTTPLRDSKIPSALSSIIGLGESLLPGRRAASSRQVALLSSLSGSLKPGTSTLVLGSPGSGKSTLLRAIAGLLSVDNTASLRYNGASGKELATAGVNVRKLIAYAPQTDVHLPLLTVRETLTFVHVNSIAPLSADAPAAAKEGVAARVEDIISVLGLSECANTMIGDAQIRGISGGQKRRVTIGEALLSGARVLALDEITNGLDAVTAANILSYITQWAHTTKGTVIAALQAPTPEVFDLFDNLILLGEGMLLYNGPIQGVRAYFHDLGFVQPSYMDIADFLAQLIVSPATTAAMFHDDAAEAGARPIDITLLTVAGLAQEWTNKGAAYVANATPSNATGKKLPSAGSTTALNATPSTALAASRGSYVAKQFGFQLSQSIFTHVALQMSRQWKLTGRNKALVMGKIMQSIVMGLIIGSVFFKTANSDFISKISLSLFTCIFLAYSNMAEIPVSRNAKAVVQQQLQRRMYPSWSYVSSIMLLQLPVTILGDIIFCTLIYWMADFARDGARWAFFVFCGVALDLAASALFRLYAYIAPTEDLAGVLAGAGTGLQLMYGGFLISYDKLKDFTYLAFYLSPFSWIVRSMADTEFGSWDRYGPLGAVYASVFGFQFSDAWRFSGPWVIIGFFYLGTGLICCSAALALLPVATERGTVRLSEYEAARKQAAGTSTKNTHLTTQSSKAFAAKVATPSGSSNQASKKPATSQHSSTSEGSSPGDVNVHVAGTALPVPPSIQHDSEDVGNSAAARQISAGTAAAAALPFQRATLAWTDIEYTVYNPRTRSQIRLLQGISGRAGPGTLTALMGASGAGKTTLMDVLANRKTVGTIVGRKLINGVELTPVAFARISAYVEQEDTHLGNTTVAEALTFSATLRLDANVSPSARDALVHSLLDVLELTSMADRVVSSLSPGERKRLSLGVELASNPSILFLDEPTTGLDARSAAVVMRVIAKVASRGVTIIATIHQPSAAVFLGFSHLLLLAPGGYTVYNGPLGVRARSMISYFESLPGVTPLPAYTNPATWMLEVVGDGNGTHTQDVSDSDAALLSPTAPTPDVGETTISAPRSNSSTKHVDSKPMPRFAQSFSRSAIATTNRKITEDAMVSKAGAAEALSTASRSRANFFQQLLVVGHRAVVDLWRDPTLQSIRLGVYLFIAIFFGVTYYMVDKSGQQGVLVRLALVFSSNVFCSIVYLNTSLPRLLLARAVFYRERAAGFYLPEVWAIAALFKEFLWTIFFSLIFSSISYFMYGFVVSAGPFFTYWLSIFLLCTEYHALAVVFSAAMPNDQVAQIIGGITITLGNLFSGIIIPVSLMPNPGPGGGPGWGFMYYTNAVAHATRLGSLPQFDGCTSILTPGCEVVVVQTNSGPTLDTAYNYAVERLSMTFDRRWEAAGWIVFIWAFFAVLGVVAHRYINHQRR